MPSRLIQWLAVLAALLPATLALPVAVMDVDDWTSNVTIADIPEEMLMKRRLGDSNNPIDVYMDVSNWQDIAEEDCRIMLCLDNANRVYQRVSGPDERQSNYQDSGAAARPFISANLDRYGTQQINSDTTSPEEWPPRSLRLGPSGRRYLVPATSRQQNSQAAGITNAYRPSGSNYLDYVRVNFNNYDTNRPFCNALFSNPPDTSVCGRTILETLFGTARRNLRTYIRYRVAGSNPIVFKRP